MIRRHLWIQECEEKVRTILIRRIVYSEENAGRMEAPFPKYGVKLSFLIRWTKQNAIPPFFTTADVCENLIKPETAMLQCSYCELLRSKKETKQYCRKAKVFISHAWQYRFSDVLQAMTDHFADEKDVVIWFDVMSYNQHLQKGLGFEWWSTTFKSAILSFGRTVMVLSPWNDPIPLRRGWCVWELFCTIEGLKAGECGFEIALSRRDVDRFIADVSACPGEAMNSMIGTIDCSSCDCTKMEDLLCIQEAISRSIGHSSLNKEILDLLTRWAVERYAEDVANLVRTVGRTNRETIVAMNILAHLHIGAGELDKAEPLLRESWELHRKAFGESHPDSLRAMNNLAAFYLNLDKYQLAESLTRECHELRRFSLGADHPDTLASLHNLAAILLRRGYLREAEPLLVQVLASRRVLLTEAHADTLLTMCLLANLYLGLSEFAKSWEIGMECLRLLRATVGETHPQTLKLFDWLASWHYHQRKFAQAELFARKCYEGSLAAFGNSRSPTIAATNLLAVTWIGQGKHVEAEDLLRDHLSGPGSGTEGLSTVNNLALALLEQGKYSEAERMYLESLELHKQRLGIVHPQTLVTMNCLATVYGKQGDRERALPLFKESITRFLREYGMNLQGADLVHGLAGAMAPLGMSLEEIESFRNQCIAAKYSSDKHSTRIEDRVGLS